MRLRQFAALGALVLPTLVAVPALAQQPNPIPAEPAPAPPPPAVPSPVVQPVAPDAASVAPAAPVPAPELPPTPPPAVTAPALELGDSAFAPDEERMMGKHPLDESKSTVKPGTGFYWESLDGDFSFAARLRAQFLYELEKEPEEDLVESLQIRRARLQFKGNFYGKHNKYKVEFAVSPGDVSQSDGSPPGTSILLDWYLDFDHIRDASLRVGQYKVPFSRQRVVSSGDLELVDRSIVNAEFNLDRDIGLDLRSSDFLGVDALRYYIGVYGGEGRNTRGTYDLGMMYLARVEVLPMGMFDDYQEGDFERVTSPKLSLAVAAAHLENERLDRGILGSVPSDGGTTDYNTLSVDAVFRYAGLSATTEWIFRDGDRQFGAEGDLEGPRDGFGGTMQLSYLVPTTRLQIAGRYSLIRSAGDSSVLPDSDELGGGISYYFAQHPFKLQADYFRLGEEDGGETLHSHRVRVQLQASY